RHRRAPATDGPAAIADTAGVACRGAGRPLRASAGASRAVSPPALGRTAAARGHRARHRDRALTAGARRADLGAGCLGPGNDPSPPRGASRAARDELPFRLARPQHRAPARGPRARDVPGPDRRARPDRIGLRPAAPPVHAGPPLGGAAAGPSLTEAPYPARWRAAKSDRPGTERLPFLRALSRGLRPLPERDAGVTVGRWRLA